MNCEEVLKSKKTRIEIKKLRSGELTEEESVKIQENKD